MSKLYFDNLLSITGFVVGLLGIGYAIGQRKKLNDICYKIDKSIDEISGNIHVDISDTVVNEAINRAVERETLFVSRNAAERVIKDVEADISNQVKTAVSDTYIDIRKSVVDETAKKVESIDIQALKAEVVEQAKEAVAEKFDNSLDDILEDFNRNLKNVSNIYQSISQTISGNPNEKEMRIRLA